MKNNLIAMKYDNFCFGIRTDNFAVRDRPGSQETRSDTVFYDNNMSVVPRRRSKHLKSFVQLGSSCSKLQMYMPD